MAVLDCAGGEGWAGAASATSLGTTSLILQVSLHPHPTTALSIPQQGSLHSTTLPLLRRSESTSWETHYIRVTATPWSDWGSLSTVAWFTIPRRRRRRYDGRHTRA